MGIGLLPWEKWLPAWLFGPLLSVGAIAFLVLVYGEKLRWWDYVLLPLAAALGVWQTWVWIKHRRNIFDDESSSTSANKSESSK